MFPGIKSAIQTSANKTVQAKMFRARKNFEIFWPVVSLVAVLMMNGFIFTQWPANHLFSYKTMLEDAPSLNSVSCVPERGNGQLRFDWRSVVGSFSTCPDGPKFSENPANVRCVVANNWGDSFGGKAGLVKPFGLFPLGGSVARHF